MGTLKNKGYLGLINLTGLIFLCFVYQVCLAASSTLEFSIAFDKSEYKPDEPVNVSFKLENKGNTPVYINKRFYLGSEGMPRAGKDVFLIVTSPSGKKLPCKFSYETGIPKSDYFELLAPGKKAASEWKRDLRGYFDFKEPGVYKVVAVYQNIFGKEIGLDAFGERLASGPVSFKMIIKE